MDSDDNPPPSDRIDQFVGFLVEHHRRLALITLTFSVIALFGLVNFKFTSSGLSFFDDTHPIKIQYDELVDEYQPLNSLVLVLDFKDQEVFTRKNLAIVNNVSLKLSELANVSQVESLTNANYIHLRDGELAVNALFPASSSDNDDIELPPLALSDRIAYAKSNIHIIDRLVSRKGTVSALYAQVIWPDELHLPQLMNTMAQTRALAKHIETEHPGVSVHLAGEVVVEHMLIDAAIKDLVQLFPIIILVGAIILFMLIPSIPIIIAGTSIIVLATGIVLGMGSWFGIVFNVNSLNIVLIIYIICLADVMHILMNLIDNMQAGAKKVEALKESLRVNFKAILLTSVTTGLGFLTLNTSASPTFVTIGNLAALGVIIAFVLTMTLLPAAILLLPITVSTKPRVINDVMGKIAIYAIQYRAPIFLITLLTLLVCLAGIPRNTLNDDVILYFKEDSTFRRDLNVATNNLMPRQRLIFSLDTQKDEGANDPVFLQQLQSFSAWLRAQEEITKVFGYEDLLISLDRGLKGGDETQGELPSSEQMASQLLLLYEMGLESGSDLDAFINGDRSAVRVIIMLREINNDDILALERRVQRWLDSNMNGVRRISAGQDLMFADLSRDVKVSMIVGSGIAIFLISGIMIFGLRSVKFGLLSLVPNAFPAAAIYGIWGWVDGTMNMAVTITFSISLGIIVDDTVHILSKFLTARHRGMNTEQAIESTFRLTGNALFATSLFIVAALLVQAQSDFGINATIGMVCAPIIAIALAFDLFFLPGFLVSLDKYFTKPDANAETR